MLRELKAKDAEGMLEWIKDPEINCFFQFNAESRDTKNILEFIEQSGQDQESKHFAIVDEDDEYLGTISLKHISSRDKNAEYAISLRKKVIGTGIAKAATEELLQVAFNQFQLNKIYLNVFEENIRAIKFYKKMGFQHEGTFKKHIKVRGQYRNLSWYAILKENYDE